MYVTQADVESRMGTLTSSQAAYFDSVLANSITSYINTQTGTQFGSEGDETEIYVEEANSGTIVIPTMHDITAVYFVGTDGTETLIPESEYFLYPRSSDNKYAVRRYQGAWLDAWPWHLNYGAYKVVGKLGYKNLPDDIKWVATELAVKGLTAYSGNIQRERVGDWDVIYKADAGAAPEVMQILSNYRRASRSLL